jgi:C1A family cysteine protease
MDWFISFKNWLRRLFLNKPLGTGRIYAWKPDVPDHRDRLFSLPIPAKLPDHVDPLGANDVVEDQGQLGSCTGHATTTAVEIITGARTQYSRLMTYYNGRLIENNVANDDGAVIRDVIKGVQKYGISRESLWPYVEAKFAKKPTAKSYTDALGLRTKIASYERITTLEQVKTALAAGLPVVFGFSVPEYFESAEVARTGWVRFPTSKDKMVGGHAVCAIGYDDRKSAPIPYVWVRNSWSSAWGLKGNFRMDQQWFTDPTRLVDDMWVIHPKV